MRAESLTGSTAVAGKSPTAVIRKAIMTTMATNSVGQASRSESYGYISNKDRYLDRLRRIEGQVRGVQRMVENDQYCIDILTQVSALTRAAQAVALGLLNDHLKHCVVDAAQLGDEEAELKLKEATDAVARLVRS